MSNPKKKAAQAIRYTDAQKNEIVNFVTSYNKTNGRGGQAQAATKYKTSQITIAGWLKAAGTAKSAPVKVAPAKVSNTASPAKAPVAKKAKKQSTAGTRYTPEQKAEILAFVASYNAANGRGGQSAAAKKFNTSPLTVMAWLKKSGAPKASAAVKSASPAKGTKVSAPQGSIDGKLSSLLAVIAQISKTEVELAHLKAKAAAIQASF